MVLLKTSLKGTEVEAHAVHPLAPEWDDAKTVEEIGRLAADLVGRSGMRSVSIYLGLPRDKVFVKYLSLPLAVKENLIETLGYEMEKFLPFSVEDIYFDHQILAEDKENGRLKILLLAVKKETLDPYLTLQEIWRAGISGIEASATALVNYFVSQEPSKATCAVFFVEADHLEAVGIDRGLATYSRSLRSPGEPQALEALLNRERDLMKRTFADPEGIFDTCLYGEGPLLDALSAGEGPLPETPWLPLSDPRLPRPLLIPSFGLALKGMGRVPMEINLLPPGLRKRPSRAPLYTLFTLGFLLVLAVLTWGGSLLLQRQVYLDAMDEELKGLQATVRQIKTLEKDCGALEKKVDFLMGLGQGQGMLLKILKELTERIPDTAWVSNVSFAKKGVEIEGFADSASELIGALEGSEMFTGASFLSTITKGKDGKEKFRIGVKVR